MRSGARVEVVLKERGSPPEAPPPLRPESVLYQDDLVVAVDKPAGVLAQEGRAGGRALPDLVAALIGGPALLVHRLDRGTTGITVLARTRAAQAALLGEFREGRAEKEYRALIAGVPRDDQGVVDAPLADDPATPGKRRVQPGGEPAVTRWQVLERFAAARGAALVAAFPETGRTHQIRVHFGSLGHPLIGDARYGGPRALTRADGSRLDARRPLLHAHRLRIRHPDGQALDLQAPEPPDLAAACAWLR